MAKKKYYAVRSGKKRGIFETWEECRKMVIGVKDAEYKSFFTMEEAENYMDVDVKKVEDFSVDYPIAYVDGSFDKKTFLYSYGVVLLLPEGDILTFSDIGENKEAALQRNVAGEVLGAMVGIKEAANRGYKKVLIKHDYTGIAHWARGEWKASTFSSITYVSFINKYKKDIEIVFEKVAAHQGIMYNEMADELAKKAIEKAVKDMRN